QNLAISHHDVEVVPACETKELTPPAGNDVPPQARRKPEARQDLDDAFVHRAVQASQIASQAVTGRYGAGISQFVLVHNRPAAGETTHDRQPGQTRVVNGVLRVLKITQ